MKQLTTTVEDYQIKEENYVIKHEKPGFFHYDQKDLQKSDLSDISCQNYSETKPYQINKNRILSYEQSQHVICVKQRNYKVSKASCSPASKNIFHSQQILIGRKGHHKNKEVFSGQTKFMEQQQLVLSSNHDRYVSNQTQCKALSVQQQQLENALRDQNYPYSPVISIGQRHQAKTNSQLANSGSLQQSQLDNQPKRQVSPKQQRKAIPEWYPTTCEVHSSQPSKQQENDRIELSTDSRSSMCSCNHESIGPARRKRVLGVASTPDQQMQKFQVEIERPGRRKLVLPAEERKVIDEVQIAEQPELIDESFVSEVEDQAEGKENKQSKRKGLRPIPGKNTLGGSFALSSNAEDSLLI